MTRRDRGVVPASGRPSAPKLLAAATWLTTPLLPDDYLSLVNPLWSIRELRGRVETVQRLTADAVSLVIRPGWGWSAHQPGQYVGIGVDSDGVRYWRTYSVTSPPSDRDDRVSIAVKAVPNGRVSQHLVHRTAVGDTLRLRRPQGEFVLPADAAVDRLLFLTGRQRHHADHGHLALPGRPRRHAGCRPAAFRAQARRGPVRRRAARAGHPVSQPAPAPAPHRHRRSADPGSATEVVPGLAGAGSVGLRPDWSA